MGNVLAITPWFGCQVSYPFCVDFCDAVPGGQRSGPWRLVQLEPSFHKPDRIGGSRRAKTWNLFKRNETLRDLNLLSKINKIN